MPRSAPSRSQRHRQKQREEWGTQRACAWCNTPFTPRTKDSLYCSKPCSTSAYEAQRKKLREQRPKTRGDEVTCPVCREGYVRQRGSSEVCDKCRQRAYDRERGQVRNGDKRSYHQANPKARRPMEDPFVSWDGEGIGTRYILLADSRGHTLFDRRGLSTRTCLEFLLDHGDTEDPHAIHTWFANTYDVTMILADLPLFDKSGAGKDFYSLYKKGEVLFDHKKIVWKPHMEFSVYDRRTGRSFTSTDTFKLFQSSFEKAAREWCSHIPEILPRGKAAREGFEGWSDEDIIAYNQSELTCHVEIMSKFREATRIAGLEVRRWYGPGALAGDFLRLHRIGEHIGILPKQVRKRVMQAYTAGWIEAAGWGWVDNWYHYDVNSAYPYALTKCISLADVEWVLVDKPKKVADPDLCHVRWDIEPNGDETRWAPFPYRMSDGTIIRPLKGEGWYWGVEVNAARRLYPKGIKIVEAYHPEPASGEYYYPFRDIIDGLVKQRLKWKAEGHPAHFPIKLVLNSMYGKVAQRTRKRWNTRINEWELDEPRLQCYVWAGFVTAHCRAQLLDAVRLSGQHVLMCQTDGVVSSVPIEGLNVGKELGQWSFEEKEKSGIIVMAGIYQAFDKDGELVTGTYHARGFDLSQHLDLSRIVDEWEKGNEAKDLCTVETRSFIGVGRATVQKQLQDQFGTFAKVTKRLAWLPRVGTEKRRGHNDSEITFFDDMYLIKNGWCDGRFHLMPIREYGEALGKRNREEWRRGGYAVPESTPYKCEEYQEVDAENEGEETDEDATGTEI